MSRNGRLPLALVCCSILTVSCAAPSEDAASSSSQSSPVSQPPSPSRMVTVGSGSPYYAKLAAVDAHSNEVTQESIDAMQRYTTILERVCPDSPEHIGDMLVAGQREMRGQGKDTSLQQLAADVSTMLTEAERSGGIPQMSSCAEAISLWVIGKPAR